MYEWLMSESNEGKSGDGSTTTASSTNASSRSTSVTMAATSDDKENMGASGMKATAKGRVSKGGAISKVKKILKSWRGLAKGK
jgi:hypothetical protein